jgi:hypothetical protein
MRWLIFEKQIGTEKVILFRLPFLQAILKEKDFGGLMKDVSSLTHSPGLGAATKKLAALLRLSSFALQDIQQQLLELPACTTPGSPERNRTRCSIPIFARGSKLVSSQDMVETLEIFATCTW